MSNETKRRVHMIYGVVLSALILTVGVCFILSCLSIYQSGASPYTIESISFHFHRIMIPVWTCLGGVLGGMILSLVLPLPYKDISPLRFPETSLSKLVARLDWDACSTDVQTAMRDERRLRRLLFIMWAVVCLSVFAFPIVWCLDASHFSVENLNDDVIAAAVLIVSAVLAAFVTSMAALYLRHASMGREAALVKSALADGYGKATVVKSAAAAQKIPVLWILRSVILVVGIVFVVLGIQNGGMADVLGKAVRICTECIGLG